MQETWVCTAGNLDLHSRKLGSATQEIWICVVAKAPAREVSTWLMLPPSKVPVTSPGKSRVARLARYVKLVHVMQMCLLMEK